MKSPIHPPMPPPSPPLPSPPSVQSRTSSLQAEASGQRLSTEGHKRGEAMWHEKYTNLLEK